MTCCRLYGSHVKGYADEGSDVDVCLILHEGAERAPIYRRVLTVGERLADLIIFGETPRYLRGTILEAHTVLYGDDLDYRL